MHAHGIRFTSHGFWVRHRRHEYGPFDYEWSKDLRGVEFTFRREKFGEFCSSDELFADLGPYRLPHAVAQVASIVIACIVDGVLRGDPPRARCAAAEFWLREHGLGHFVHFILEDDFES